MASTSRRVSASLSDLRRIYRAGARGARVSLAARVAASGSKRRKPNKKRRNAPRLRAAKPHRRTRKRTAKKGRR